MLIAARSSQNWRLVLRECKRLAISDLRRIHHDCRFYVRHGLSAPNESETDYRPAARDVGIIAPDNRQFALFA
jgi:hypothetical protein